MNEAISFIMNENKIYFTLDERTIKSNNKIQQDTEKSEVTNLIKFCEKKN